MNYIFFKKLVSIVCVIIMVASYCTVVAAVDTAATAIMLEYYNNPFDNGINDFKAHTDFNGTFSFTSGHNLATSEYNGNKGVGSSQTGEYGYDKFAYTFTNPINRGVVSYSFDASRLDNETVMQSIIQLNNFNGYTTKNVLYIGPTIYGPNNNLAEWGDSSVKVNYEPDTVYNIRMDLDFDVHKVRTYIDNSLLSEKSIAENFELKSINFNMRNSAAYMDNIRVDYKGASTHRYDNTFDNGITDCTAYSDVNGTLVFDDGHGFHDAEYNDNKGIGSSEDGQWNYDKFTYTFTTPVESGVVSYSFDASRLSNESVMQSVIQLNGISGQTEKNVLYIGSVIYGPMNNLTEWGDNSVKVDYEQDTVYNIRMDLDFDVQKVRTYIDNIMLSERSIPANFKLYNIRFNMRNSVAYMDNLKIEHTYNYPVELRISSDMPGNIYHSDTADFKFSFLNRMGNEICSNYNIAVTDMYGDMVYQDILKDVILKRNGADERIVTIPIYKYGTYTLTVEDSFDKVFRCEFSKSVSSQYNNPKSGICVHLYEKWLPYGKSEILMEIADNAGFGYTRSDWPRMMNDDGELSDYYETNKKFSTYITESISRGIKMLGLVVSINGNGDEDGGLDCSQENIAALEVYCEKLAEKYKGVIDYYEIGNEVNELKNSDGSYVPASDYVKLLDAAYKGIKKGDDNAKVVAFSSTGMVSSTVNYIKDALNIMKENGMYCFDVISIHPYHGVTSPEFSDYMNTNNMTWKNQYDKLKAILDEFELSNIECWATETGTYTGETYPQQSFRNQAMWYVRQMILNEIYDMYERLFFYEFQDEYMDNESGERYGLIRHWNNMNWTHHTAYTAKPSYVAISYLNSILSNAKFENVTISENEKLYRAKFNKDSTQIEVLWDVDDEGKTVTIDATKSVVSVYDMYGNLLKIVNGKEFTEYVNGEPKVIFYEDLAIRTLLNGCPVSSFLNAKNDDTICFEIFSKYPDAEFIVAKYNDDVLVNVLHIKPDESEYAYLDTTYKKDEKYKIMLLQNFQNIKPLMKSVSF